MENRALKSYLREIEDNLNDFMVFLNSSKFQGFESDGSRKDWMAISDIQTKMQELRQISIQR